MSESKHTKGEWAVHQLKDKDWNHVTIETGNCVIGVKKADSKSGITHPKIARTYPNKNRGEELANARLIAAAPEMLEWLETFVKWDTDYPVQMKYYAFRRIIEESKIIIAKAKGEKNETEN